LTPSVRPGASASAELADLLEAEWSAARPGEPVVRRHLGAGIFQALLDDDKRVFQEQVLSGPPPLGPGAEPLDRLIACGRARAGFLLEHREIARAALDGSQPVSAATSASTSSPAPASPSPLALIASRPGQTRPSPGCTSGCCSGR
jgi:hypothetical protein